MSKLNGKRFAPIPKQRYRIERVIAKPNINITNSSDIANFKEGDEIEFSLAGKEGEYIPVSHAFDYVESPVWNTSWKVFVIRNNRRQELTVLPYTRIAKLFGDEEAIKHNWEFSFGSYTESSLDDDSPELDHAKEHFLPNFVVVAI